MIKVICVGKIKERYLKEACEEYKKRISRWIKIQEIEVNEEPERYEVSKIIEKEAENLMRFIDKNDYNIVLDIKGDEMTSEQFSDLIKSLIINNKDITFIIGGSNGLSNSVKHLSNKKISFSKMTFPHQLFRVILYEQVYRALSIINNSKYHK